MARGRKEEEDRTPEDGDETGGPERGGKGGAAGADAPRGRERLSSIRLASSSASLLGADAEEGAGPPAQKYVISHLLSVHAPGVRRADAVDIFNNRLQRVLSRVGVLQDAGLESLPGSQDENVPSRRVLVVEGDHADLRSLAAELPEHSVVEPVLSRVPAVAYPPGLVPAAAGAPAAAAAAPATTPGTGSVLTLALRDPSGQPVEGATVLVRFNGVQDPNATVTAGGRSDSEGAVAVDYDPNQWRPALAAVEPDGRFWTQVTNMPQPGQIVQMRDLPQAGPFGWWQLLSGAVAYDPHAGRGIRVGVVDSGVGPHPALRHAVPIGAFVDGTITLGEREGRDVQTHGTHVSGIIGARPAQAGAYGGLAPGADLYVARIFSDTGGGTQGDVASAIDTLAQVHNVDVINLSLIGAPSSIEYDAVILAYQRGTLCICAAGNQSGAPVAFPAAYPECVAVSALGLVNSMPVDSMPGQMVPTQPDRFGLNGIFLAAFSNVGPQIDVASPGNGIISTIPTNEGNPAPYADMSGTSMASPMVAGVLANLLSRDATYQALPRGPGRANYARALLGLRAIRVLGNPVYEGHGLARVG